MSRKSHALYLSIICVLLLPLMLSFNFRSLNVSEQEPTCRIVLLPFRAANSSPSIASYHLTNGLLWELSKIKDVTVIHPNSLIPSIRQATNFANWLKSQDESLVLIGTVSGPEENLAVKIVVFDTRAQSIDRVLEETLMTDIYDLEYAYEALASNVVSIADRRLPH